MHYFQSSDGTHFNFNSDLSGEVLIGGMPVTGEALLEFFRHYKTEYPELWKEKEDSWNSKT